MTASHLELTIDSPEETAAMAVSLGTTLMPGDCLLLSGEIGSGKTHFARSLIQSMMTEPEDVPSPTFTLVQVYDTDRGELWHSDLYRLSSLEEIEELGLSEAFNNAITLVEWPDRLGPLTPPHALMITFEIDPEHETRRKLTVEWTDPKWPPRLT
ncbi:tRNA (adenosine(37)-N6)-threonylcarbamoyltransferase complex ATPase subunit type 1 TsaE [Ruegeria sp. WL0004]|uniref:tRNA threonylcarbamoyladenosine biosynthesis protein TsaE n=1 Tax=Ruegeria marisflavi TaxID=2984152 RepID=A0ABT2WMS2_9RHOB|nr:tRNA (adenosine(37)-N6)-threonylcarbamoyltransferase complex ATPase subunit type 1 TsaE [Ruegeria sp. WL0004]MCU9837189.1 tRNA (adenosine(37)-N6)-threonylcarbamoyltransferase complex ATPase subunit type 1 TsaE [Ruegeria sp. WL0004]